MCRLVMFSIWTVGEARLFASQFSVSELSRFCGFNECIETKMDESIKTDLGSGLSNFEHVNPGFI